MNEKKPLQILLDTLPQAGKVKWIRIRPGRGEPMVSRDAVLINSGTGLEGDRFSGNAMGSLYVQE